MGAMKVARLSHEKTARKPAGVLVTNLKKSARHRSSFTKEPKRNPPASMRSSMKRKMHAKPMKNQRFCIHLIDASVYIFRAFFSLPSSITDPKGRPSSAVVGFGGFLSRYIHDHRPTHMALCFDSDGTSKSRSGKYPEYKTNRPPPPDKLSCQWDRCREVAKAFGVKCFEQPGVEADDLIASLSVPLLKQGHHVVVVSSDKDLYQLVGPQLSVFNFAKEERYDQKGVLKRMGVKPDQVVDYLGLAGDAVDNIPGVRGLGSKTAIALLSKFNHLEDIYAKLDRVKSMLLRGSEGIAAKLSEQRDVAFMSRDLATLLKVRIKGGTLANLLRKKPTSREETLIDLGVSRLVNRVREFPSVKELLR